MQKELNIFEVQKQISALTVLRSFPKLTLKQSLVLQENLNKLKVIDDSFAESDRIIKEKLSNLEEDSQKPLTEEVQTLKLSILKDYSELIKTTYTLEFKTLPVSIFPEDLPSFPNKKITTQKGTEVEINYNECLLDSLDYSITLE